MSFENILAAVSGAIGAFIGINKAYSNFQDRLDRRFRNIENDLETLEDRVIRDYVLKEDFRREMESVHKKLDRILDRLMASGTHLG
jgi:hypothetical protein